MQKTTSKAGSFKSKVTGTLRTLSPKGATGKYAVGVLAAAPVILLVLLLIKYSVNVPFYDQWELVDLFKKSREGTLGFADFFAQHNEHRLLFPRIVMFVVASATSWNVNYELVVSLILAVISFIFILKVLQKTLNSSWLYAVGAVLLSLIFFSPLQWENWMWGWQIQWFMNVLGIVVAVWALTSWGQKSQIKKIVVASIASIVATYSLGSGLFVWLICLPVFVFRKELRKYTPYWLLAALITIVSHYIGYHNPGYHPSKSLFLDQPIQFVHYVVVYLVRPINFDILLSAEFGLALALISISVGGYLFYANRKELLGPLLPWLCFILYGFLAAASTGVSRLGFGVNQGYANRYVTLSNFCIIGLVVIVLRTFEITQHRSKLEKVVRGACVVTIVMCGLLVLLNYSKGIEQMKQQNRHLLKARQCAQQATSESDDCLLLLYPNKPVVWEKLKYLRGIQWGGL